MVAGKHQCSLWRALLPIGFSFCDRSAIMTQILIRPPTYLELNPWTQINRASQLNAKFIIAP